MTQFQQVLAAIKALGGKGTPKEIYAKIKEANPDGWKTKTPYASVSTYLSTSDIFRNENGTWILQDTQSRDDTRSGDKRAPSGPSERGLYFITVSPHINIHGAGFLFKIGKSDSVKKRLVAYSASLPVDTIQLISFYPIPPDVNLSEVEKEVRGELLGNENLGEETFDHKITIRPYFGNHQDEWLQTLDITLSDTESLNKLANIIDGIVKTTIETLTPGLKEDVLNE
jgi:hypothetical protein